VPFRLTQNLVDAMGVTGYEGVFRKAGEVTMQLLRANSDTLMSVLESFIHDPLVEWNRRKVVSVHRLLIVQKYDKGAAPADGDNDEGRRALLIIRGKLGGQINKEELPLSAEGQVDELIRMAVSPARLVAMYIGKCLIQSPLTNLGWAAFM
jgi:serine/threonine-protein kinase ATR